MWVVCHIAPLIHPKPFEKGGPEDVGNEPGIREGWNPPSQDDRVFGYPEEDTRYLISVHKIKLQVSKQRVAFVFGLGTQTEEECKE
jgi:hypothetical protein